MDLKAQAALLSDNKTENSIVIRCRLQQGKCELQVNHHAWIGFNLLG